jgi:hypothetical protein
MKIVFLLIWIIIRTDLRFLVCFLIFKSTAPIFHSQELSNHTYQFLNNLSKEFVIFTLSFSGSSFTFFVDAIFAILHIVGKDFTGVIFQLDKSTTKLFCQILNKKLFSIYSTGCESIAVHDVSLFSSIKLSTIYIVLGLTIPKIIFIQEDNSSAILKEEENIRDSKFILLRIYSNFTERFKSTGLFAFNFVPTKDMFADILMTKSFFGSNSYIFGMTIFC